MLKQVITIIVIIVSVLEFTGCLPDHGNLKLKTRGDKSNFPEINKPLSDFFDSDEINLEDLKAVEMDLTFLDIAASMLRMNQIMLKMKVSGGAEWPKVLDLKKQNSTEGYTLWLRDQSKKNFSFLEMYQDLFMIDVKFFGCWTTIKERLFIEVMKKISINLLHQKQILDYRPEGCGGPGIIFQDRNKRQIYDCQKLINSRKTKCSCFDKRLEDQLFSHMTKNKSFMKWVNVEVNPSCLRTIKSPKHKIYKDFEDAFFSLLPKNCLQEIKKCKSSILHLNNSITKKEKELKEIESDEMQKNEEKQNQRKDIIEDIKTTKQKINNLELDSSNLDKLEELENELIRKEKVLQATFKGNLQEINSKRKKSINKEIEGFQKKISNQKDLYQKYLKDSLDSPSIYEKSNEDTIDLVRNLKRIASAINNNLSIAIKSSSIATTKLIYDLKTMNAVRLNIDKVSKTLAYEFILRKMYNKMTTIDRIKLSLFSIFTWVDTRQEINIPVKELNQTQEYMIEKWNKLIKKAIYVIPISIRIANEVKVQNFLMKLIKQYLDKLDEIIVKQYKAE